MDYGIHWFRRDLRVAGNPALKWNFKEHQGKVLGVFTFDKKFLARTDFSVNRFQFFLDTLIQLREDLNARGGDLLVLDTGPFDAFAKLFELLKHPPKTVSWNRDYEPFARERDKKMEAFLKKKAIAFHTERDHLLIEPHELYKGDNENSSYQVFTPFFRKWMELYKTPEIQRRVLEQKTALHRFNSSQTEKVFQIKWTDLLPKSIYQDLECLKPYHQLNKKSVSIPIPKAGTLAAIERATQFKKHVNNYTTFRDIPSVVGTSQLSLFFKNGSLTTSGTMGILGLEKVPLEKSGAHTYLKELAWREFYYHILYHHPRVEKEAFLSQYQSIKWENNKTYFKAWKEGMTGFPIVDAGMRELKQTGWMHNRVRMIVASFLTKDLLINWQWGEQYFMEQLLDGDLAPNNGGWQWAASTGCDPQPYFRIFNPKLQSERFDPEGKYIKRFIPELKHLQARQIHEPAPLERRKYPMPIIEHASQKDKALALYKRVP